MLTFWELTRIRKLCRGPRGNPRSPNGPFMEPASNTIINMGESQQMVTILAEKTPHRCGASEIRQNKPSALLVCGQSQKRVFLQHTYMPTLIHTYPHQHKHTPIHLNTHLHKYTPKYAHIQTHTYTQISIHTYKHLTCTHTHIHKHLYTPETHTYAHQHTTTHA